MASLKTHLIDAKVDEIHRIVENGNQKFLCFTRTVDNSWFLCVTDGTDIWRIEMDSDEIESYKDLAEMSTLEAFWGKFRKGFVDGDLSVAQIGTKVTMSIGKGSDSLAFDLYEARSADRKTELQGVLFRLANMSTDLQHDLSAANKKIETLKAQKAQGGTSAFMDLGPKRTANQTKPKPNKAGMSVLNPSSKKRKAATGVVFD